MSQNEKLISDLIAARDSLNSENWRKGAHFKTEPGNPNICMCAHGALQIQVNPVCRKAYEENKDPYAAFTSGVFQAQRAMDYKNNNPSQSLQQLWDNRPVPFKQDFIYRDQNYGKSEAHYLLVMVGLTTIFNDHSNTTLEMVKAKFDEAIELAKTLD